MITGLGVDIVEIERMRAALERQATAEGTAVLRRGARVL